MSKYITKTQDLGNPLPDLQSILNTKLKHEAMKCGWIYNGYSIGYTATIAWDARDGTERWFLYRYSVNEANELDEQSIRENVLKLFIHHYNDLYDEHKMPGLGHIA